MVRHGVDVVAMEVSSIGLAQHRVDGTPFAVAVFTNLSRDHLDFHGTMHAYLAAKARLFSELLRPDGVAILNADDPASVTLGPGTTVGFAAGADVRIAAAELHAGWTRVTLAGRDGEVRIDSPLVGRHNAANLAAAYAVLRALGIPAADAARGAGAATGAPGRLERVPDPGGRLVLVDYAHSDDALANVLPTVRELVPGTVWVVFGCGGDRDRGKRPAMGAVARRLADRVIVTSDNPRSEDPASIAADVLAGMADRSGVVVELDREAAIRYAIRHSGAGDAVLLAGKGHETTQETAGVKRPFDDRVVARRALDEVRP
jgi:UDP-N-acetylmuramoyl-L-alanyl-D-glutamate--2,6-diaminopimelate ligase